MNKILQKTKTHEIYLYLFIYFRYKVTEHTHAYPARTHVRKNIYKWRNLSQNNNQAF